MSDEPREPAPTPTDGRAAVPDDDRAEAAGFRHLSRALWFRLTAVVVLFGLPFNLVFGLHGSRVFDFGDAWRQMGSYPEGNGGPCRPMPADVLGQAAAVFSHDPAVGLAAILGPIAFLGGLVLLTRPWGRWARLEPVPRRAWIAPLALVGLGLVALLATLLAVFVANLIS